MPPCTNEKMGQEIVNVMGKYWWDEDGNKMVKEDGTIMKERGGGGIFKSVARISPNCAAISALDF